MSDPAAPDSALAIERAKQVFRFLNDFAQKNVPHKRHVMEHHWLQRLRDFPTHKAISVGEVHLTTEPSDDAAKEIAQGALITIRRAETQKPPSPPAAILDFLQSGWQNPDGAIALAETREMVRKGERVIERFDESLERVEALAKWRAAWDVWAEQERPARRALQVFNRFFDLKSRIDRDSERVELILADGVLKWNSPQGAVDHPVLLQRVELVFDPDIPEFRVVDSDREPELYQAVLEVADSLSSQALHSLRADLTKGGYHPLEDGYTTGFLKRLVQTLAPDGRFEESDSAGGPAPYPAISRNPVLFLRDRSSGFPAAFDRVLEDLEARAEVPVALSRLVGVEPPMAPRTESSVASPWGEPPDILLSKPANEEQIRLARALDHHKAVLVQGPPGTGKSHTIANIIGHLVAQGKRVLVTSHTTKALRVLRGHIVESLRPLCVALLENDLEGRTQMEEAVKGIISRLTTSTKADLELEVSRLSELRTKLNNEIARITRDLHLARESEYLPIQLAGESVDPLKAADWVKSNTEGNGWIPGKVSPGAQLPLSHAELAELYGTSVAIAADEEAELGVGVPRTEEIIEEEEFTKLVDHTRAVEPPDLTTFWSRPPLEEELSVLETLDGTATNAAEAIRRMEAWQRSIVAAGHGGGADVQLWHELDRLVFAAREKLEKAKASFIEHDPQLPRAQATAEAVRITRELTEHMDNGGGLGRLTLMMHSEWKRFLTSARCNDHLPTTKGEIRALRMRAELEESRDKLRRRWQRQCEPIGLSPFATFGDDPELRLSEYVRQVPQLLGWWSSTWPRIESALSDAGFQWEAFRNREVARSGPTSSFERDVVLLGETLPKVIRARLGVVRRTRALRLLREYADLLAPFSGPKSRAMHETVRLGAVEGYGHAHKALRELVQKSTILTRRNELLSKLAASAPEWSKAIRTRAPGHDGAAVPGDDALAWRWRQLDQELKRRANLDDVKLARELEERQKDLRTTTAELIDRRAWLGQVKRVDLSANQALQGWAQTQKRIGKGTGKRVPQLQAEARKLLTKARDAVPVWIMPLSRVAESFDPTKGKFDVVIVDEASQSDMMGLLAWYIGDRVAIVGDHEQVSPLGVGQKLDQVQTLINQHLVGIPNSHLYDGQLSIYDLARNSFGGTIALKEHFRCVPDIIEFSNHLSYNGEIRPLRNPLRVPRPHVVEYVVDASLEDPGKKVNVAEARTLVAIMRALIELPENEGRSFGAIALVGDEQAGLIQEIALEVLGAVELERRHFASGNPGQFQGDERDIILLSMVDRPAERVLSIRQQDLFKQRYNVAASRSRDQLWLVHSLNPDRDLHAGDLRRRLIEHVREPRARKELIEQAQKRAESPFEKSVLQHLISAGYRVEPQVVVGNHRIDMVVADDNGQIALECDGDRYHGVDQIPADMARQAILERAGWRFIRIRGTSYYRDPEATMKRVFFELNRWGIQPSSGATNGSSVSSHDTSFRDAISRRAWEIMREYGWVQPVEDESSEGHGLE